MTAPQSESIEHPFAQFVRILGKGKKGARSLNREEAEQAMLMILNGDAKPEQIGAFLMLLRVQEETADELAGFVSAARQTINAPFIRCDIDWSSYAGKRRQLPWYLLSIFLLAENGYRVFIHGHSGHTTGRLYTDQCLQALGFNVANNWQDVEQQLQRQNFSYLSLNQFCPPLSQMISMRNVLGLRSVAHTLSRLLNPLRADVSLQSIFHPAYAEKHQYAALQLQQKNMAVIKGDGGEFERKPEATCLVKSIMDGELLEEKWPRLFTDRQSGCDVLDPSTLMQVWRGAANDQYGYTATTGTLALILRLMQIAPSPEDATELANQWWGKRDRSFL